MRPVAFLLLLAGAVPARAEDPLIEQAIEQLMRDDGDSGLAERVLKGLPERVAVIEAAERALAQDARSVGAKRRLLSLLFRLEQGDLVERALGSSSLSTKRAAAVLLAEAPPDAAVTKAILLAWVAEDPRPVPALLVEACRKARLAEAAPWLSTLLEAPETSPQVFADALAVLATHPSPELAQIVKKRLADPDEDPTRVRACIDALRMFPDLDADALLLPWLKRREPRIPRLMAVLRIGDLAVLRALLLDTNETDSILQHTCLYRLAEAVDDAPLLELLRDPRVNHHRDFAIRVDVCTALACVEGAGAPDIPLLLDYLVDEDAQDKTHIVRSEAWLTLWTLTGEMHGAQGDFAKLPPRGGRERRCRGGHLRDGITPGQCHELELLAKDLDHMRTVRAAYAPAR